MIDVLWLTPDKPENISVGRQRIAKHLERNGFQVTLRGMTLPTAFTTLLDSKEYDVIIGTTRSGAIIGTIASSTADTPFLVDHIDPIRQFSEHNPNWLTQIVRHLENISFSTSDCTMYVYDEEQQRVSSYARSSVQTNLGVDFEQFANPDSVAVETARIEFSEHVSTEKVAIYIGGLEQIYHIQEIIAAAELLEDWTVVLLGDGPLRGMVENHAADSDSVSYLGTVDHENIPGFLHLADVGLSLVDDPHTLKVLEYGAAGLPTVQLSGRVETYFGDRLTYCDLTPESIAAAIVKANNHGDTENLQRFVEGFDWKNIAQTYASVLKSIM